MKSLLITLVGVASAVSLLCDSGVITTAAAKVSAERRRSSLQGGLPPQHRFAPSQWMGDFLPLLPADTTLLDLSLPGTHDTATADLTHSVADFANDVTPAVAALLHDLDALVTDVGAAEIIRRQAVSQGLNLTAQLDAGIRFIDFRAVYSAAPGAPSGNHTGLDNSSSYPGYDWYGLHLLQTATTSLTFLAQIKAWLLAHPSEMIVLWVSHHGDNCNENFEVPAPVLQAFWRDIQALFMRPGGQQSMLWDQEQFPINTTTIQSQRCVQGDKVGAALDCSGTTPAGAALPQVVVYLAQFDAFTGSSTTRYASTDCHVDNHGDEDAFNVSGLAATYRHTYSGPRIQPYMAADKAMNSFYLVSMAGILESTDYFIYTILLYYISILNHPQHQQPQPPQRLHGAVAAAESSTHAVTAAFAARLRRIRRSIVDAIPGDLGRRAASAVADGITRRHHNQNYITANGNIVARADDSSVDNTVAELTAKCAALLLVPGIDAWCPTTILEASQFKNYYMQGVFEGVVSRSNASVASSSSPQATPDRFPNAIYINAADVDGTIRIGNGNTLPPVPGAAEQGVKEVASMSSSSSSSTDNGLQRYNYLHTLLLATLNNLGCGAQAAAGVCASAVADLEALRAAYPLQVWNDPAQGRLPNIPFA